ncbi:dipeptide ABC transporter ATP-binding protein [Desulfoluna sp.]|uniref:ABC transporter ATP-binding protein n=1 Tax=Desulfoluna sp. TaxID=2045199 RepID=UPI002631C2A3|nr:dipeptide ABC transporter ATP-binding protein [Desulfoluna sp.]
MTNLLTVENLKVHFPVKGGFCGYSDVVHAVDGVNLTLKKGETLGIVGESGCGKTTTGLGIMKLVEKTQGTLNFDGADLDSLSPAELRKTRQKMQMIFQDPFSSLNPRMTVNRAIGEPMKVHGMGNKTERADRVAWLLKKVGLSPEQGNLYPHEFSGGQRQRIGIARALALNPLMIIGDEPVSALDVSIQAQIINLLIDIQKEFNLSYVIISHDLAVVEHICDRIAVMYLGKVVEEGTCEEVYANPRHPYTKALLSAIPYPDPDRPRDRIILTGDVPSPIHPPKGCNFHPRCPNRQEGCDLVEPDLEMKSPGRKVACHYF